MQYFENLQKYLNEHQELSSTFEFKKEEHVVEQVSKVISLKNLYKVICSYCYNCKKNDSSSKSIILNVS